MILDYIKFYLLVILTELPAEPPNELRDEREGLLMREASLTIERTHRKPT